MSTFHDLIDLCQGKNIYIQTHDFPDPDAIASAYGLQKLLGLMGIYSEICYAGKINKLSIRKMQEAFDIEMYSCEQLKKKMKETDYIICVDSQKNAGNITGFTGNEIACIDHHPVFANAQYQYLDIRFTGACATIIANYYFTLQCEPDKNTATALLYGIKMDTLQFTRGVTSLDITMYGFLHPLCDQEKLNRLRRNNVELKDLKAYSAAFDNIRLCGKNGFAYIPFACSDALIATISDFILSLAEVNIAIVCALRQDGIKISVRSELLTVHAGRLIKEAIKGLGDGGGHADMAGGLISEENIDLLGNFPDYKIMDLFMKVIEKADQI